MDDNVVEAFAPGPEDQYKSENQTLYYVLAVLCLIAILACTGFMFYKLYGWTNPETFDNYQEFRGITVKGVCYDYDAPTYLAKSTNCDNFKALLDADFSQIKGMGFDAIRTYWPNMGGQKGCQCNSSLVTGAYTEMANKHGLKVLLGIQTDIYNSNQWELADCVKNIAKASNVIGVLIGNEDVNNDSSKVDAIIKAYKELKPLVRVPIGTAQQFGFWLKDSSGNHKQPYDRLVQTLDFCGANVYAGPFPGTSDPDKNKQSIVSELNDLKDALGDKLWVTEIGIPHSGSNSTTGASFTQDIQNRFIKDVMEWNDQNNVPMFIFEAFDEPNKTDQSGLDVERHFGILQH